MVADAKREKKFQPLLVFALVLISQKTCLLWLVRTLSTCWKSSWVYIIWKKNWLGSLWIKEIFFFSKQHTNRKRWCFHLKRHGILRDRSPETAEITWNGVFRLAILNAKSWKTLKMCWFIEGPDPFWFRISAFFVKWVTLLSAVEFSHCRIGRPNPMFHQNIANVICEAQPTIVIAAFVHL